MCGSGHRIMPARVPRVTSKQPPRREVAAAPEPMREDGLLRILGTGRIKPAARPEHRAQNVPIDFQQRNGRASNHHARGNSRSSSRRASGIAASVKFALTETRKSCAGKSVRRKRNISRTTRRIRLRATAAFTTLFPTRTTSRGYPTAFPARLTMNQRPR